MYVYACLRSAPPHIWIADHAISASVSLSPSLGTHSFNPNPVHSLLILTLVVEAVHSSYVPGEQTVKMTSFAVQAFTAL